MFKINFNRESLNKSQNGNITGRISISLNGYDFPEKNWNDFVVIVVNWWLENIDLKDEMVFRFMDGPFYFIVKNENDDLQISLKKDAKVLKRDKISKEHLFQELKIAALSILKSCQDLKWESTELRELSKKVESFG